MLVRRMVGTACVLTLDRPNAGNALNAQLCDAILAALDAVVADAGTRAIVLAGSRKFFCAGGDIKEYARIDDAAALDMVSARVQRVFEAVAALPLPAIAAIEGYALGAGAELALACDLRVMGGDATLGLPQTELGIIPSAFTFRRLVALVGYATAYETIALATRFDASAARERGLVNQVCLPGLALETALGLARRLDGRGPDALAATKRLLGEAARGARALAADVDDATRALWFGDFHRAAERAFVERRGTTDTGAVSVQGGAGTT